MRTRIPCYNFTSCKLINLSNFWVLLLGEPLIIVEFLPCGDLLDILRRPESQKSSNSFLQESDFINFAQDIARGMGHLHACKVSC